MDVTPQSKKGPTNSLRVAVFARNHPEYLQAAAKKPSSLVTFQSKIRWTRVQKALTNQGTVMIYFAPNGTKKIQYEAVIREVDLEPSKESPLLEFRLDETAEEEVWGETLYTISNWRKLPALKLSDLQKEDGTPLSEDFQYSYAIVRELPEYLPEELPAKGEYPEGAVRQVVVDAYERNPAARAACLEHYGSDCVVYGFSFAATYGEIGRDFIHVHHLRPLASIKQGYSVDPIAGLRPVCPNCHAMLHRGNLSVEELAVVLKDRVKPLLVA
jgi:hypothetical protein